eukprot:5317049-Amphidinium_carterae.2
MAGLGIGLIDTRLTNWRHSCLQLESYGLLLTALCRDVRGERRAAELHQKSNAEPLSNSTVNMISTESELQ